MFDDRHKINEVPQVGKLSDKSTSESPFFLGEILENGVIKMFFTHVELTILSNQK